MPNAERPTSELVRPEFVAQMNRELVRNGHKGPWQHWTPNPTEAIRELKHHVEKLITALDGSHRTDVTEYSADIANIVMKIAEGHGE